MITLKNRTLLPVVESFMKYVREVTPEVAVNKFSNQGTSEQVEHWKNLHHGLKPPSHSEPLTRVANGSRNEATQFIILRGK